VSGPGGTDAFGSSRATFEEVISFLGSQEAAGLEHGALEETIETRGREVLRQLLGDHLRLRAATEERLEGVTDALGTARTSTETGHRRSLVSVFGEVIVERLAYRRRSEENLHPADARLNLPAESHSHGLRRLAAIEAARGSFDEARSAIARATGQALGKRQVESLAAKSATDVGAFYETRSGTPCQKGCDLVLSVDGKGIVMLPEALRDATKKKAAAASTKLAGRLSKGEKHGRKRMAELGALYEIVPVPRTAHDVMASAEEKTKVKGPEAERKWLVASVVDDAASVIAQVFDEAERRDPDHEHNWVGLVDGNSHQIDRMENEAKDRGVDLTILIDLVHVLEYLWKAAWSFFDEGDPAAEAWVLDRAHAILAGNACDVATGIRRRASAEGLAKSARQGADICARYLTGHAKYLDYPSALASGWPVATGIIEGACRHIVKDRMDITGARWSLAGAEAVLSLRAVRANGDFDEYWRFHLSRELERMHLSRYADRVIPMAA
jgi:hypothetical protein